MRERLLPQKHFETAYEECSRVKQGRFICSQCDKSFYHATRLVAHCQEDHHLKICMEQIIIIVLGIVLACAISYTNKNIEVSKLEDIS